MQLFMSKISMIYARVRWRNVLITFIPFALRTFGLSLSPSLFTSRHSLLPSVLTPSSSPDHVFIPTFEGSI